MPQPSTPVVPTGRPDRPGQRRSSEHYGFPDHPPAATSAVRARAPRTTPRRRRVLGAGALAAVLALGAGSIGFTAAHAATGDPGRGGGAVHAGAGRGDRPHDARADGR